MLRSGAGLSCGNPAVRVLYGPPAKAHGGRVAYAMCAACAEVAVGRGMPVVMTGQPYKLATVSASKAPAQAPVEPPKPIVDTPVTKLAANAKNLAKRKR